jgi:hypothetical protein
VGSLGEIENGLKREVKKENFADLKIQPKFL